MRCRTCGAENKSYAKFCEKCGKALQEEPSGEVAQGTRSPGFTGTNVLRDHRKQVIAGGIVLLVAAACIGGFLIYSNSQKTAKYNGRIESGDKYLAAMDYAKAETAFQEAINIQPKKEDAYAKLADLYTEQSRYGKAVEILQKGQKKAGGKTIDSKLKKAKKIKKAGANQEQAEAYLELWEKYQSKYGNGGYAAEDYETSRFDLKGLCLAKRFDFNSDGNAELILAWSDETVGGTATFYKYEIWAWENGKAVNILGKTPVNQGQDLGMWIETAVKDKTTYLVKNDPEAEVEFLKYSSGEFKQEPAVAPEYEEDWGYKFDEDMEYEAANSGKVFICLSYLTKSYAQAVLDDTTQTIQELEEVEALEEEKTAEAQVSDPEKYQTYYDLCMEYQEKYGKGGTITNLERYGEGVPEETADRVDLTGLCVAKGFDFDEDGNEELLLVYRNEDPTEEGPYSYEVWVWEDGKAVNVLPKTFARYGDDAVCNWIQTEVRDGKTYLTAISNDIGVDIDRYCTRCMAYEEGEFKTEYEFEIVDNTDYTNYKTDNLEYFINGEKMSENAAEKELENFPTGEIDADDLYNGVEPRVGHYKAVDHGKLLIFLSNLSQPYAQEVLADTAENIERFKNAAQR